MHSPRFSVAIACFLVPLASYAANPTKVSVSGVSIVLPTPDGFTEPSKSAPILHSRAEQLTAQPMRLLAVHVTDSDVRATRIGSAPTFKRYFMTTVLRSKEADVLDSNAFAAVKAQVSRGQPEDAFRKTIDGVREHVGEVARNVGNESGHPQLAMKIGEVRQMGVFGETDSSISTLVASGVAATNGQRDYSAIMAQATSFVLLQGKVVMFTAYSKVESDADYAWLRSQSAAWIQSALLANPK